MTQKKCWRARIVATRSPRERLALLGTKGIAQKIKIKSRDAMYISFE
jgi:hypothetical protein